MVIIPVAASTAKRANSTPVVAGAAATVDQFSSLVVAGAAALVEQGTGRDIR